MRALLLAFVSLMAFSAQIANASVGLPLQFHGTGSAVSTGCVYADDGGCAGAPADGSFIQSNFWTVVKQSGQGSYHDASGINAHPPTWNMAGVDYPIGYSLTVAGGALKDPSIDALPSGCSYSSTGSVRGGGKVSCTPTGVMLIQNFDFCLHNSIPLLINSGGTKVTVYNNHFCIGSNIAAVDGVITATTTNGANTLHMTALASGAAPVVGQRVQPVDPTTQINTSSPTIASVVSAWDGTSGDYTLSSNCSSAAPSSCGSQSYMVGKVQGWIIAVVNPSTVDFELFNNQIDGNETTVPLSETACVWSNNTSGKLTVKYTVFNDCGRPITSNSFGQRLFQYDFNYSFGRNLSDGHGEIDFAGANGQTFPLFQYSYSTSYITKDNIPNCCTTTWYPTPTTGNFASTFVTSVIADHDVAICNSNGGLGGAVQIAGCGLEKDSSDATYGTCSFSDFYIDPTGSLSLIEDPHVPVPDTCVDTFSNVVNMLNGNTTNVYNNIP